LDGEDFFEFNTELISPLLQQRGGLSRVRYEIRPDSDETATIYRSEQVLLADLAASEALPFISGVKNFRMRYYRNGNWLDQWSSGNLPRMVEISFELAIGERTVPFRSSFVLPEGR